MKKTPIRVGLVLLLACSGLMFGQQPNQSSAPVIDVAPGYLQSQGAQVTYGKNTRITSSPLAASTVPQDSTAQQQVIPHVVSVPLFAGQFKFKKFPFPYVMVGLDPVRGGKTNIKTQLIPISVAFLGPNGNPLPFFLDVTPVLQPTLDSPNFRNALYETGNTQFADAVQRAEFFNTMSPTWHTILQTPKFLPSVTVEVPFGSYRLFRQPGGFFAVVDQDFFISQLNTIVQLDDLDISSLAIALTYNVLLAPQVSLKQCCELGFHTAFVSNQVGSNLLIQTFAYASWLDPGIINNGFADVTPLSHEISEFINDPFGFNPVPPWTNPDGSGGCQANLETGDPIEGLPYATFPVQIGSFVYHPQNEALLQWFERAVPSDAFGGAYSFPNKTVLTGPSQPCGK